VNGVFLVALCFTIFLDAIERFASPEPVTNPVMVLATGSAGLVANIIGLFLFHGKKQKVMYCFSVSYSN
jgi:zinc transporter 1